MCTAPHYRVDTTGGYRERGSRTSAGAGVESLQIPCMMRGNFRAAEVKHDGMVGTVGTLGQGPQPVMGSTTDYMAVGDQITMDLLVSV
jgi:hypothetical protein